MKDIIKDLIISLDNIDWSDRNVAHKKVEQSLKKIKTNLPSFQFEIANLSSGFSKNLSELSVETPTHFKWFLHENQEADYKVWLHEYKTKIKKNAGYAIISHNHRYWFSSFIINGGFTNSIYQIERVDEESIKQYSLVDKEEFDKGKIYTLNSDIIHSLSNFKELTITIIIQSKTLKDFSESFNFEKKTIQRHYSFASRLNEFKQIIKSI